MIYFRWYKFFDLNRNFHFYLEEIWSKVNLGQWSNRLDHYAIALVQLLFGLNLISLWAFERSDYWRLMAYDMTLMLNSPTVINLLVAIYGAGAMIYYHVLYVRTGRNRFAALGILLLYQIVIQNDYRFFFKSRIKYRGTQRMSIQDAVRHYGKLSSIVMKSFVYFECFYLTWIFVISWKLLLIDHLSSVFGSILNGLGLIQFITCGIVFYFFMFQVSISCSLIYFVIAYFTFVIFTQLGQINQLLSVKRFTFGILKVFERHHTKAFLTIESFNRNTFSQLLLALIGIMSPASAYMLTELQFQWKFFTRSTIVTYVFFIAIQFLFIFTLHIVAAMYRNRIHKCARPLMHLCAAKSIAGKHRRLAAGSNWIFKTRLLIYAEKFYTNKQYGITYGDYALVSFWSFFKFVLLYGEFCMYWYQLIHK